MTAARRRRWLILSHAYNVDGRAESLTITDKIPHLLAAGIEPVVFSSVMGEPDPRVRHLQMLPWGPAGMRFDLRHLLRRRFGRGAAYRTLTLLVTTLLALPILLERLVVGLRSQWSWALPALVRGAALLRSGEVELVYSTGGVFSAHLAGAWLKHWTGCRWIAEVHDPLVIPGRAPRGRHERFLARLEGRICRDADLAWWFTDAALAAARRRHPGLGARGIVVLPGAEPPVVQAAYRRGPRCVLGHFGSLATTRSLSPAMQAIARLLQREPGLREVLRLEVYGSALDPQAAQLLGSLQLEGVVLPIGRLEHDPATGLSGRARVMQRMQQCDLLLMLHGDQPEACEYIPSKLYDYFWARRPVLGLTHENPQLDALIAAHGGWAVPTRDIDAVTDALAAALQRWRADALPAVDVPPVSVAGAVRQIVAATEELGRG